MLALHAQHEANGVHDVAFTGTIRPYDTREVVKWPYYGPAGVALEILELQHSKLTHALLLTSKAKFVKHMPH